MAEIRCHGYDLGIAILPLAVPPGRILLPCPCNAFSHTHTYTHARVDTCVHVTYAHFVLSWHEDRLVCKQFHFCCCRPFSEVAWKEEGNRRAKQGRPGEFMCTSEYMLRA